MCPVCLLERILIPQESCILAIIDFEESLGDSCDIVTLDSAQADLKIVDGKLLTIRDHKQVNENQRLQYEFECESLNDYLCVIVMDYKENISLGRGPIETKHDFFRRLQISVLGFAVIYLHNGNKN